ncbi:MULTISPECIES: hypothetical protein [unclassified Streptomyces]|uniref:hypothetical protein n=1 Tax=unclassified Streptomyces TaxID=2593676 RepID=UPI001F03F838|nr:MULTISPECIES: hypothetical protein [unclassified Streptomyces]
MPIPDHYAENHGFMQPLPLHGRARCEGLAEADRIRQALEPLRERRDFSPAGTAAALAALGHTAPGTRTESLGPTGVGFLVDEGRMCLEGRMYDGGVDVDAFGGYPDHPGCERPSGGH